MINGTKLLNVAGMTRGRRDGILKSEKVRHVVKIGPMHLKGVWCGIPPLESDRLARAWTNRFCTTGFRLSVHWTLQTRRRSRSSYIRCLCTILVLSSITQQTPTERTRSWLQPSVGERTALC